MSYEAAQEIAKRAYEQLPFLCNKFNVKLLSDFHLDPNHKVFVLFEAHTEEALRDLITMVGFVYCQGFNFHL
jgi:hypothetical protein